MIISNIVLAVLLIGTIIAWNYGWIEARNKYIKESKSSVQTEINKDMESRKAKLEK